MLTRIWLLFCAFAHLNGALPIFFPKLMTFDNPVRTAALEWCKVDSRFCDGNPCVRSFETLTCLYAVPICLLLVYAKSVGKAVWWEHPLQIVLSTGHLMGTCMYFLSLFFDPRGLFGVLPSDKFWTMGVGLHSLWFVIPLLLLSSSMNFVRNAIQLAAANNEGGKVKKN